MFLDAPRFADVKILTLNFAHTNKMRYREYLKEVLGRLDAAQVYAELSLYGDKYSARYKRELEAAHPELKSPVLAATGTGKYKPRSKKELIELLDMGLQLPLDKIDTSCITDMEGFFRYSKCRDFIGIETWDTSNVVTMKNMFAGAEYFDHDISAWNVSKVRDMSHMFDGARRFNKPLNDWDVSNVENMYEMFDGARKFNQPLNNWNVSNVRNMSRMFAWASKFNKPLDNWNVSNVENMYEMFYYAEKFNQPLNNWNVSNVRKMTRMFGGAEKFNKPLNDWNVSNVENMVDMFYNASSFNQPLDRWDVSKVKDMTCMFYGATSFRQPITAWKLCGQSTRDIFLDLPDYRDMESRVMCLAVLDGNYREYELQEMIRIFGKKAVHDALQIYGAKYGLKE